MITDLNHTKWKYYFPCGMWLARDEGDGAISRYLIGSKDPFAIRKGVGALALKTIMFLKNSNEMHINFTSHI